MEKISDVEFQVWSLEETQKIPEIDFDGLLITGALFSVWEMPKLEEISAWIRKIHERKIPILGVCFGHQLIAHAFGGKIAKNPKGWEFGTVDVNFLDSCENEPIFHGISTPFLAQLTHEDIVIKNPPNAKILAKSELTENQAMKIGDSTFGVQFHPEITADILKMALKLRTTESFYATHEIVETSIATKVLQNFADLL